MWGKQLESESERACIETRHPFGCFHVRDQLVLIQVLHSHGKVGFRASFCEWPKVFENDLVVIAINDHGITERVTYCSQPGPPMLAQQGETGTKAEPFG